MSDNSSEGVLLPDDSFSPVNPRPEEVCLTPNSVGPEVEVRYNVLNLVKAPGSKSSASSRVAATHHPSTASHVIEAKPYPSTASHSADTRSSIASRSVTKHPSTASHIIVAPPISSRRSIQRSQTPPDLQKGVSRIEVTPDKAGGKGIGPSKREGERQRGRGVASEEAGSSDEVLKWSFAAWSKKTKKQRSVLVEESKLLHDYNVKYIDCTLCHKSISSSQLRQHMETVHEITVSYDCDACHLTGFKSKLALRIHFLNHHRLHCSLCRKKLDSKAALLAHRKKHNDEPFDCRECGKSFSAKSVLVQHSFIQHPLTTFSCRECVQFFPSAREKRTHDRIAHQRHPFRCPVCRRVFLVKRLYLLHIKAEGGCTEISKRKCPHCPLQLRDKSLFQIHKACCRFKKSYSKHRSIGLTSQTPIVHGQSKLARVKPRGQGTCARRPRPKPNNSDLDVRPSSSSLSISSSLSSLEHKSQTQMSPADISVANEGQCDDGHSDQKPPAVICEEISCGPRAIFFAHSINHFLKFGLTSTAVQKSNTAEVNVAEVQVPFKIEPVVSSNLRDNVCEENNADISLSNPPAAISADFSSVPPSNSEYLNVPVAKNACHPIIDSLEIGEILGEIFGQSAVPDASELHMPRTPGVIAEPCTPVCEMKPNVPVEAGLNRIPSLLPSLPPCTHQ